MTYKPTYDIYKLEAWVKAKMKESLAQEVESNEYGSEIEQASCGGRVDAFFEVFEKISELRGEQQ